MKHEGHKRKYTGEPYMVHLEAVADLVRSVGAHEKVIAAAYLHDTLEDTKTTYGELINHFGVGVATLVYELTDAHPSGAGHGNRAERKRKERDRLAKASAAAHTLKLADLIDNTKSIVERDPRFAKVYLREKADLLKVLTKGDKKLMAKAKEVTRT